MHSIQIKVPELEPYDSYVKKAPQERERYQESKLFKFIQLNSDKGVTIGIMAERTYFHRNSISQHVKNLITKGEVYQYPPDSKNGLLFSNGNLLDPIFKHTLNLSNKFFTVYVVQNKLGRFLYLQEKKEDMFGQIETKGGIVIPLNELTEFNQQLQDVIKTLERKRITTGGT